MFGTSSCKPEQACGVAGEHLVHGLRGTERVRNALSG
ncbi:MAG: hypothetical protein PWR07_1823 [Bacillota bacterium]|nr:hypothetical protein [Bacillota bacterium]